MTDWKQRCSQLADELDNALNYTVSSDTRRYMEALIASTRAALAKPEPEEQISAARIAQILLAHSSVEPIMGTSRIIYQSKIMPLANEICERFAKPESDGTANEKS